METLLKNKFYYFCFNEYLYSDTEGSNISELSQSLLSILTNREFTDLIVNVGIIKDVSVFDRFLETLKSVDTIDASYKSHNNLSARVTELENKIKANEFTYIPYVRENHATGIAIINKKLTQVYDVYILNSGFGSNYHPSKIDNTRLVESVIAKHKIESDVLKYFLYFSCMSETFGEFYNTAGSVLNNKSIKSSSVNDFLVSDEKSESNFWEAQKVGNCTYRSVTLAFYVYLCKLAGISSEDFKNLMFMMKLFIYNMLLNNILQVFKNPKSKYEFIKSSLHNRTVYNFSREYMHDLSAQYFTDNTVFATFLEQLTTKQTNIDDAIINDYTTDYPKFNRPPTDIDFSMRPVESESSNNAYMIKKPTFDNYLHSQSKSNETIKICDELSILENIDETINIFIKSGDFLDINQDLNHIFREMIRKTGLTHSELLQPNQLNGKAMLTLSLLNSYIEEIYKSIDLKSVSSISEYLDQIHTSKAVLDYNNFKIIQDAAIKIQRTNCISDLLNSKLANQLFPIIKDHDNGDFAYNDFFNKKIIDLEDSIKHIYINKENIESSFVSFIKYLAYKIFDEIRKKTLEYISKESHNLGFIGTVDKYATFLSDIFNDKIRMNFTTKLNSNYEYIYTDPTIEEGQRFRRIDSNNLENPSNTLSQFLITYMIGNNEVISTSNNLITTQQRYDYANSLGLKNFSPKLAFEKDNGNSLPIIQELNLFFKNLQAGTLKHSLQSMLTHVLNIIYKCDSYIETNVIYSINIEPNQPCKKNNYMSNIKPEFIPKFKHLLSKYTKKIKNIKQVTEELINQASIEFKELKDQTVSNEESKEESPKINRIITDMNEMTLDDIFSSNHIIDPSKYADLFVNIFAHAHMTLLTEFQRGYHRGEQKYIDEVLEPFGGKGNISVSPSLFDEVKRQFINNASALKKLFVSAIITNNILNPYYKLIKVTETINEVFKVNIIPTHPLTCEQNTLSSFVLDFINNPFGELRDTPQIIPNIYMLSKSEIAQVEEKTDSRLIIGDKFYNPNYTNNLADNVASIDLDLIEKFIDNTTNKEKINKHKEKLFYLVIYLFIYSLTSSNQILTDKYYKLNSVIAKLKNYKSEYTTHNIDLIILTELIIDLRINKFKITIPDAIRKLITITIQHEFLSNEQCYEFTKAIHMLLIKYAYDNPVHQKRISDLLSANKILGELDYQTIELQKIIKYYNIPKSTKSYSENAMIVFTHDTNTFNLVEIKSETPQSSHGSSGYGYRPQVQPKIVPKNVYIYINDQLVVSSDHLNSIPEFLCDNYIFTCPDNETLATRTILINNNAPYMSDLTIKKQGSTVSFTAKLKILNNLIECTLINKKYYESILNQFLLSDTDSLSNTLIFVDSTDKIYVYYPNLSLIYISWDKILQVYIPKHNTIYDVTTNKYLYLQGANTSFQILKSANQYKLLWPKFMGTDGSNITKPLLNSPFRLPDRLFLFEAPSNITREKTKIEYNKSNVKEYSISLADLIINVAGNIIGMSFLNSDDAASLYFLSSFTENYTLSKFAYNYITSMTQISSLFKYEKYLGGPFPFNKLLFANKTNRSISEDEKLSMIIINRNLPLSLKFPKQFFDVFDSDKLTFSYIVKPIGIYARFSNPYDTTQKQVLSIKCITESMGINRNYDKIKFTAFVTDKSHPVEIRTIIQNWMFRTFDYEERCKGGEFISFNFIDTKLNISYTREDIDDTLGIKDTTFKKPKEFWDVVKTEPINKKIKWDILKMDNMSEYLLILPEIIDGINREHIDNISHYSDINKSTHEQITKYLEAEYKYTITDINGFKNHIVKIIQTSLDNVLRKIRLYGNLYEKLTKTKQINQLTGYIKLTEYIFYLTLELRYKVLLRKLGIEYTKDESFNTNYKDLSEQTYDLTTNINLFMKDLEQLPGYIDPVHHSCKVNTLIIFYDYYFSKLLNDKNQLWGGTIIRPEQYKLISEIISSECKANNTYKFYQMIMGAGKSSYIAPLLSLLLIASGYYPIHVMPESLIPQAVENMNILKLFDSNTINKKINRIAAADSIYTLNEISGDNTQLLNYIFSDSDIKCMILNVQTKNISKQPGEISAAELLKSKLEKCFIIFDEIDDISNPFSCELNFPHTPSRVPIDLLNTRVNWLIDFLQLFYVKEIREANKLILGPNELEEQTSKKLSLYYITRPIDENILKQLYEPRLTIIKNLINNLFGFEFIDTIEQLINKTAYITNCKKLEANANLPTEIIQQADWVYNILFTVIPVVLNSINRKDFGTFDLYGPNPDIPETLHKSNLLAIPFKSVETPNIKSEFSNVNITIAMTIISYFSNHGILRPGDYNMELKTLENAYYSMSEDAWKISDAKIKYDKIISVISSNKIPKDTLSILEYTTWEKISGVIPQTQTPESPEHILALKKQQINLLREYLQKLSAKLLSEYRYQLNSTFCDIASSSFCANRTGFSGTPYFESPLDINNKKELELVPIADDKAEGSIAYSIASPDVKLYSIKTRIDILEHLKRYPRIYTVLVDVGAYWVGESNKIVAENIIDTCMYITDIIYLDEQNQQVFITRDNRTPRYISDTSSSYWDEPTRYTFIFFDQKHITGIDIKVIKIDARGLITMKSSTNIRDFAQGTYRLRKINITQHIDICIDPNTVERIQLAGKQSTQDHNKQVLNLLLSNQSMLKSQSTRLQALHNFRTIFRNQLESWNNTKILFSIARKHLSLSTWMVNSTFGLATQIGNIGAQQIDLYIKEILELNEYLKTISVDEYLNKKISILIQKLKEPKYNEIAQTAIHEREDEMEILEMQHEIRQDERQQVQNKSQEILLAAFSKFNNINHNYSLNDLVNLRSLGSYTDADAHLYTLIKYNYTDKIYLTKLFIYRYMVQKYLPNAIKYSWAFKVVENIEQKKLIIMTQEEYNQVKSLITVYPEEFVDKLDLNPKYWESIPLLCLVEYITDKSMGYITNFMDMLQTYINPDAITDFKLFSMKVAPVDQLAVSKFPDILMGIITDAKEHVPSINLIEQASQISQALDVIRQPIYEESKEESNEIKQFTEFLSKSLDQSQIELLTKIFSRFGFKNSQQVQSGGFYDKYLKYRTKYFNLLAHLKNN